MVQSTKDQIRKNVPEPLDRACTGVYPSEAKFELHIIVVGAVLRKNSPKVPGASFASNRNVTTGRFVHGPHRPEVGNEADAESGRCAVGSDHLASDPIMDFLAIDKIFMNCRMKHKSGPIDSIRPCRRSIVSRFST